MTDYIVRATAGDHQVRAFAATTRELVEHARHAHNTSPVATAALGRLLTAGAMMGVMMKGDDDLLTLKVQGSGPIEGLTVTADSKGNVKGYAFNPGVMLPPNEKGKLDVGGAVGEGVLSVIKDIGLKEPYVGQTILVGGEIAEDLTSITSLLDEGNTPEMILDHILGEFGLEIMDKVPAEFTCNCTKERVEKALISIGKKELNEMIDEGESIEVNCHFCNRHYNFSVEELTDIRDRAVR